MRLLIALAAIAVLGCSATDMLLLTTSLNSINTAILAASVAQNAQRARDAQAACERRSGCDCPAEQQRAR